MQTALDPKRGAIAAAVFKRVEELRRGNGGVHQQLIVTRPGDFFEQFFFQNLIEERGVAGGPSYGEFVVHLYRQVAGQK